MLKLKTILHKIFGNNTTIDKILSGKLQYSKLTTEQDSSIYSEGWFYYESIK